MTRAVQIWGNQQLAEKELAKKLEKESEPEPCPKCGHLSNASKKQSQKIFRQFIMGVFACGFFSWAMWQADITAERQKGFILIGRFLFPMATAACLFVAFLEAQKWRRSK